MRAIEADTGAVIWETSYSASFKMNPATSRHGPGPKSTPTYADGRLFTLGISGIVSAFNAADGKIVWQKPAPPVDPLYGTAMSPIGDQVIVIPQSAVAIDQTGPYVFVVDQDNKVEQRRVRIGTVRDGLAVVNEGIEPGERVVVQGQQRIRAGIIVTPQLAPSPAG